MGTVMAPTPSVFDNVGVWLEARRHQYWGADLRYQKAGEGVDRHLRAGKPDRFAAGAARALRAWRGAAITTPRDSARSGSGRRPRRRGQVWENCG